MGVPLPSPGGPGPHESSIFRAGDSREGPDTKGAEQVGLKLRPQRQGRGATRETERTFQGRRNPERAAVRGGDAEGWEPWEAGWGEGRICLEEGGSSNMDLIIRRELIR